MYRFSGDALLSCTLVYSDPIVIGLSLDVIELYQMEKYKSKPSNSYVPTIHSQHKHI